MKQLYIKPQVERIVGSELMFEGHLTTISGDKVTQPAQGREFSSSWNFMPSEAADEEALQ